jgi:hypothetical protein
MESQILKIEGTWSNFADRKAKAKKEKLSGQSVVVQW